jgi:hypothetical protein
MKQAASFATRRYIPEDRTLHNHRCENLTSYLTVTIEPGVGVANGSVSVGIAVSAYGEKRHF